MSRPLPTTYTPVDALPFAALEPIKEGAASGHVGPLDVARNIHYLYGVGHRPVIVLDTFNGATVGYINGEDAGREEIAVLYTREPSEAPFSDYQIKVLYENTSSTDAGIIRVELGSDPWVSGGSPGTSVDLAAAAGSGKWTAASGTMGADTAQALDTIRVWVNNGASGVVRLHSIAIYPVALAAIDAGAEALLEVGGGGSRDQTGLRFVPHDTEELDADSPWSIHQAGLMNANLEHIRRARKSTIVSHCTRLEQTTGAGPLQESSSDYVTHASIPFKSGRGQTSIRWSLYGYRVGTSGAVRLRVVSDGADVSSHEEDLGATWDSGTAYSAALHWSGATVKALECAAGKRQRLEIDIKGDGTDESRLYSICAWFAEGE